MHILMIGFDSGRWGAARLVKALGDAGFRVAALCMRDNPLTQTRYLDKHFPLGSVQSSGHFESRLAEAMRDWDPKLIVPIDEHVIACLHALIRRTQSGGASPLSPEALATVLHSMGYPDQFDATLLKSSTLQLAAELGVRIPVRESVTSPDAAATVAAEIGFPVYVKTSFSWAGQGVTLCRNAAETAAAVTAAQPRSGPPLRKALKRILHRDWYPTNTAIDVQQSIAGTPAMYCAVAADGRLIAGFAGLKQQTCSANGPSSIVKIGTNIEMERASATMIRAFGTTGFIAFDFMIESATGDIYLLECNPRPTPICHLGARIGVDLCDALAAELSGLEYSPAIEDKEETITLFPQEWQRNPEGIAKTGNYIDIPLDDPELLRAIVNAFDGSASVRTASTRTEEPVIAQPVEQRPSLVWR